MKKKYVMKHAKIKWDQNMICSTMTKYNWITVHAFRKLSNESDSKIKILWLIILSQYHYFFLFVKKRDINYNVICLIISWFLESHQRTSTKSHTFICTRCWFGKSLNRLVQRACCRDGYKEYSQKFLSQRERYNCKRFIHLFVHQFWYSIHGC